MTATGGLVVTGVAATTAVGWKAVQTAASVRAGMSRFREHPFHYTLIDPPYLDEPAKLSCAPVTFLDPMLPAAERLLFLALYPLQEVFERAALTREDLGEAALFLSAPPAVEGIPEWGMEQKLLPELFRRAGLAPLPALLDRRGATGFFHLLDKAARVLADGKRRFAIVGGVESYLYEEAVTHYDTVYRFKSSRARDGFIPGEAAAYLLIESEASAKRRKAPVLARIASPALGMEEAPYTGDANSTGAGFTSAIRSALAGGTVPDWVISDFNGERYRGYEWGLVQTRLAQELSGMRAHWHPADSFGDVRAAAAAVQSVLAAEAFAGGYAPGNSCLVVAGTDEGERGALMVSSAGNGGKRS